MSTPLARSRRVRPVAAALLAVLAALAGILALTTDGSATGAGTRIGASIPPVGHVFVINIENKGYDTTFGAGSKAPYLAKTLRAKGVLLDSYYGTAHNSQPNYVAQVSGQGPNPVMQSDCQTYSDFQQSGTTAPQQAQGSGCIFPRGVPSVMRQLDAHHRSWRGYMDGMGKACRHPAVNSADNTQTASKTNEYATRHDPFMYFHDVIDHPRYCASHVVGLSALPKDLRQVRTTRNLTYITPDLCNDGHDAPCANGQAGGLTSVNRFLKIWVPRILHSPAYRRNGVLVITADESDSPQSDSSSCCNEQAANTPMAGIGGSGGGKIGALALSRWTRGGSWATTPYNHYSLLATIDDAFRLGRIGYARTVPDRFGLDVFNNGWNR